MMHDGIVTPCAHDGMAAFPGAHRRVYLIPNHEVGEGPDASAPAIAYDEQAGANPVSTSGGNVGQGQYSSTTWAVGQRRDLIDH